MMGVKMRIFLCLMFVLNGFAHDYQETLHSSWRQSFEIKKILHQEKSDFWDLIIFENPIFGKILGIDGTIQLTEKDEFIYHEMMAHVPLLSHTGPSSVLIVGGGDGGLLREVLKHSTVKKVVLVEIDPHVMNLVKQFMPQVPNGAFEDPRTEVVIQDAAQYVKESTDRFDVILCDTTDPIGPAEVLFTSEFYKNCKTLLSQDGILVIQSGVPFVQKEELHMTFKNRKPHFKEVTYYVAPVPTYIGGFATFGWSSDKHYRVSLATLKERMKGMKGALKYYNPKIHKASFILPEYIQQELKK